MGGALCDLTEDVDRSHIEECAGGEKHTEPCDWELDCVHDLEWEFSLILHSKDHSWNWKNP